MRSLIWANTTTSSVVLFLPLVFVQPVLTVCLITCGHGHLILLPVKPFSGSRPTKVLNKLVSCQARLFAYCLASFPSLASYSQSFGSSRTSHVHPCLSALACSNLSFWNANSPLSKLLLQHNFPCGGFPGVEPVTVRMEWNSSAPLTLTQDKLSPAPAGLVSVSQAG